MIYFFLKKIFNKLFKLLNLLDVKIRNCLINSCIKLFIKDKITCFIKPSKKNIFFLIIYKKF